MHRLPPRRGCGDIPSVRGLAPSVFIAGMVAYRSGTREHQVMNTVSRRLGDEGDRGACGLFRDGRVNILAARVRGDQTRPAPTKAPKGCKGRNCNDHQQTGVSWHTAAAAASLSAPMIARAQTRARRRRHRRRIGRGHGRALHFARDGADAIDVTPDRILAAVLHLLFLEPLSRRFLRPRGHRPWATAGWPEPTAST